MNRAATPQESFLDHAARRGDARYNFADGIGNDQYNLELSRRRAAAVKDALVKRYGINAGRLATSGFGKSQPKNTNDTIEGQARNRRVELAKVG